MRLHYLVSMMLACGAAVAETSPYYIGVNQAFSYDSNVFRLPQGQAEASSWSSTSVVAGFDQHYGRQRFYASGNVAANVYQQLGELDNTSYALNAGWDWATIERLSGKLFVSTNQNLGNYGGENDTLIRTKNVQNGTRAFATAEYGLLSLILFDARLAYNGTRYSAQEYARYELTQQSGSLGVRKQFGGQLVLGAGGVYTTGSYWAIDRDFDRADAYLSGYWTPTGQSTLSGRLSYSSWDYTGLNPYTTSGLTGWAKWDYVPTGKLSFNTLLSYDTLANSGLTDLGGGAIGQLGDTNQLTAAFKFGVDYAFSEKLKFNASLDFYRRNQDYQISPPPGFPPSTIETRDRVTNVALGATWTPTRNWQVNCNASSNNRNQDANQPITLTPYKAWGASCSVQVVLQ